MKQVKEIPLSERRPATMCWVIDYGIDVDLGLAPQRLTAKASVRLHRYHYLGSIRPLLAIGAAPHAPKASRRPLRMNRIVSSSAHGTVQFFALVPQNAASHLLCCPPRSTHQVTIGPGD